MNIKRIIIALFLSLACAFSVDFFKTSVLVEKDVIHLKDGGTPTIVDTVSVVNQFIFYEKNGLKQMYLKSDVEKLGKTTIERTLTGEQVVVRILGKTGTALGPAGPIISSLDYRIAVFLAVFLFVMIIMFLYSTLQGKQEKKEKHSPQKKDGERERSAPVLEDQEKVLPGESDAHEYRSIALFFLEIFKIQSRVPPDASSRFSSVGPFIKGRGKTFDLHVKTESDWINRRMSIAPLAEGSGAKSKCFYVIYDSHMVVKIPPSPVTDIKSYLNHIRKEGKIAANLSPVECIVPMVSVILKKIHKLPYAKDLNTEQIEKRYIRLLEEKEAYQQFLKIGNQFAFFMELSNNFFLGRVIGELHEIRENITDEMTQRPQIAWDHQEFTGRYGLESLPIFTRLQALYRQFDAGVWKIAKEEDLFSSVHKYQIQAWFLSIATGGMSNIDTDDFNERFSSQLKKLAASIEASGKQTIDVLNRMVKKKQKTELFLKNKKQVGNIVTHMMDLLVILRKKGMALRDLKPDNLFIAADPDKYPGILKTPAHFSIGVIDVETAVVFRKKPGGVPDQPMLGGTPLYATPFHIIPREGLLTLSDDIAWLLHLQDWYAVIAIIYKTVTGRNLFFKAAGTFPKMIKQIKSSSRSSMPGKEDIKKISAFFWKNAVSDFKQGMAGNAYLLKQIIAMVPKEISQLLLPELNRELMVIKGAIFKYVSTSPFSKTEKNRDYLRKASEETILRLAAKWENHAELPQKHHEIAPDMTAFLKNLYRLKQGEAEVLSAIARLKQPQPEIRVYSLMESMFQIAFNAMYKKHWKMPESDMATEPEDTIADDASIVTTFLSKTQM